MRPSCRQSGSCQCGEQWSRTPACSVPPTSWLTEKSPRPWREGAWALLRARRPFRVMHRTADAAGGLSEPFLVRLGSKRCLDQALTWRQTTCRSRRSVTVIHWRCVGVCGASGTRHYCVSSGGWCSLVCGFTLTPRGDGDSRMRHTLASVLSLLCATAPPSRTPLCDFIIPTPPPRPQLLCSRQVL